jgi:hypothetical protein
MTDCRAQGEELASERVAGRQPGPKVVKAVGVSALNPIAHKKARQVAHKLAVRDLLRARDQ